MVVLVTAPSVDDALSLGRTLVDERLAACVNVVPGVTSIYVWEGARQETPEALLVVKTEACRYTELEHRVLALHTYSVPEVLGLAVDVGSAAYARWVRDAVAVEGR
ncbi:MAG: divalent-cation tolerance protein CutA [Candidatus Rokubacteria bacterium]|nr:divalent-cation tolerance protein CutA [Candidatus Rokubacteria bacterium]